MSERRAHEAYDAECARKGTEPSDADRAEFVSEWQHLNEEGRLNAIEAQQYFDPYRFQP